MDVRPTVCGNALEETRGKEIELATDMIISRTLQLLLEGCDLEHLCSFLLNSVEDFPSIAVDKFGSHVAETALKSLAIHLQEDQSYSMVEETLYKICQVLIFLELWLLATSSRSLIFILITSNHTSILSLR